MREIKYITAEDLIKIVDIINNLEYENKEEVPSYDTEMDAIDNYFSLIDRSKLNYYPDVLSKASFLFININSHYFSNGNKRLSVTSTAYFLEMNGYTFKNISKDEYKKIFNDIFGKTKVVDFSDFPSVNFALYNLAIIVASKAKESIDFDKFKEQITQFFRLSVVKEEKKSAFMRYSHKKEGKTLDV